MCGPCVKIHHKVYAAQNDSTDGIDWTEQILGICTVECNRRLVLGPGAPGGPLVSKSGRLAGISCAERYKQLQGRPRHPTHMFIHRPQNPSTSALSQPAN